VTAVVIGAGLRGREVYGRYALEHPEALRVVGVAEPDPARRAAFAAAHALAPDAVCADWRPLLTGPRRAELAVVATGDSLHVPPALAALAAGYHLLLEKPIAPDPADCVRVVEAAERAGRMLQIGHVLRYTPFYAAAREVVASGRIGRVVALELREGVATWHMTHSFVRGKFRNRAIAAPFLLAKSCHDLDLLVWLAGAPARRVASFGALSGYAAQRAPEGAPERCTDGCPVQERCPHDAQRFYLSPDDALAAGWPWSDLGVDPSRAARRRALEVGPYGRCVYRCDNDVLDHQVVCVDFEGGATGSFGVHGHATSEGRSLRVAGSAGELWGALEEGRLQVSTHGAFGREELRFEASALGHYGGDRGLLDHFLGAIARGAPDAVLASGRVALESHLLGFAAERARERGCVVEMEAYRAEVLRTARGPVRESGA
jgi:predicted dehydrogenase